MAAVTNAGRDLIAQQVGLKQDVVIDRFLFANIDGLVETDPVDLDEPMPAAPDIVATVPVTRAGYVNADQVVYSVVLDSLAGDYDFNWVGLLAADDTLVCVEYSPLQQKRKTVGSTPGNTLTRNFLLAFTNAASVTNITIGAETWQIDFSERIRASDERERLANTDTYGDQAFYETGWEVWNDSGTFKVKPGVGYVAGIRIELEAEQTIDPGVLPKDIWLDVSLQGDLSGLAAVADFVFNNAPQSNYDDAQIRQHYLLKVASIDAAQGVADLRRVLNATDFMGYILAFVHDRNWKLAPDGYAALPGEHLVADNQTAACKTWLPDGPHSNRDIIAFSLSGADYEQYPHTVDHLTDPIMGEVGPVEITNNKYDYAFQWVGGSLGWRMKRTAKMGVV